ncbi:ketoacyl-ACP synthase III [Pseudomonas azotoformans]
MKISNQHVLDLIERHSKKNFEGDLTHTLTVIDKLLTKNGTESRYWLAKNESPMALMKTAFAAALKQANIDKKSIDLLIFASVGRGFIEPANSAFIAKALELTCRNHDVVNACMGWVTSMDIINDKMKAKTIRHAAIVNMEFGANAEQRTVSNNFALRSPSELAYKLPSFNLGEAVTVTLLSNENPNNFTFNYINRPDLCDLCTVTLDDWRSFCNASDIDRIAHGQGSLQFTSFGEKMHKIGIKESITLLSESICKTDNIDCIFTHTSSPKTYEIILSPFDLVNKNHTIGKYVGNIASASVPYGIFDAMKQGVLTRDNDCLVCTGSAGMSFATVKFKS